MRSVRNNDVEIILTDENLVGNQSKYSPRGSYYMKENHIKISTYNYDNFKSEGTDYIDAHVILHEIIHSITYRGLHSLKSDDPINKELDNILETLKIKALSGEIDAYYAFSNKDELFAEAFANPDVMQVLMETEYHSKYTKTKTLWEAFINMIARMLGISSYNKNNVFTTLISILDDISSSKPSSTNNNRTTNRMSNIPLYSISSMESKRDPNNKTFSAVNYRLAQIFSPQDLSDARNYMQRSFQN
jgi:hypothetical protein